MTTPVILVGGVQPPPLGSKPNGTIAYGTSSVAIALSSTTGIGSIRWTLAQKPTGSACAVTDTAPTPPFATTLGPFDTEGTYVLRAEANGDGANQYAEVTLAVQSRLTNLRKPGTAEQTGWDTTSGWGEAIHALFDFVATGGSAASTAITDADTTLTPSQYCKKFLVITGTLTADRTITLPAISGAMFVVRNNATANKNLAFKASGGSELLVAAYGETLLLWCDGSEYREVGDRFGDTMRLVASNITANNKDRTMAVDTSGGTPITVTLPSNPKLGQRHTIYDAAGNASVRNITIAGNGKNINGSASVTISANYGAKTLSCFGTGWVMF